MMTLEYDQIMSAIQQLNTTQFKLFLEELPALQKKKEAALELAKKRQSHCPHCTSKKFIKHGLPNDIQRFKCKECGKTFNSLTATPLARLRKKAKWVTFSKCLIEGDSVRKSAEKCGVHQSTSFRWRHKFLETPKSIVPNTLSGIVELKETHIPYSRKGERNLDRPARKRGIDPTKQTNNTKQVCILIERNRNKDTVDHVFNSIDYQSLKEKLLPKLEKDVLLCSDAKNYYHELTRNEHLRHGVLNLEENVEVVKDIVHLRNATDYHIRLANWMHKFRGVATKYLENYLGWFRNLDEFNMDMHHLTLLFRAHSHQPYLHQPLMRTEPEAPPQK